MVKNEVRVLGIDDAPFDKFKDHKAMIIGTFYRGGSFLDGVLSAEVTVDGTDATQAIIRMVRQSKFRPQLQAIMLDGIAVAGFNIIDINAVHQKTGIPVIVTMRSHPRLNEMKAALCKIGKSRRISLLEKAGKIQLFKGIHYQTAGISKEKAEEILNITTTHSNIPEPLRVAHIIASGLIKGESRGKA